MKKVLLGLIMAILAVAVNAESVPTRQVTIITSFPVGSGPDNVLRKIQPGLEKTWGTKVLIENKPGGNGTVAYDACNKAVNDSQNVNLCYTEAAVFWAIPQIYGNDDVTKNLKFFGNSHYAPLVLATSTNVTTKQGLVDHVRANPNFGSWSVGSVGQISGQELSDQLHILAKHVAYKDYGIWLADVSNETLSYSFVTLGSGQALYRAGKIRFVAVATDERDPVFSDVPTVKEYTGNRNWVNLGAYASFYVRKDIPTDVERSLKSGMTQVLATTDVKSDLIIRGYRPWNHSDTETQKIMAAEQVYYYRALKQFNINLRP